MDSVRAPQRASRVERSINRPNVVPMLNRIRGHPGPLAFLGVSQCTQGKVLQAGLPPHERWKVAALALDRMDRIGSAGGQAGSSQVLKTRAVYWPIHLNHGWGLALCCNGLPNWH